jgi:hypothetical protein
MAGESENGGSEAVVVVADKNTVVLPFGRKAVALTWIGM